MSDASPVRGGIYTHTGAHHNELVIISLDALNRAGTVIACEISARAPVGARGLLAIQLTDADPMPGQWVLCWRVNYAAATRFEQPGHGVVTDETMTKIVAGLRSAIEPL